MSEIEQWSFANFASMKMIAFAVFFCLFSLIQKIKPHQNKGVHFKENWLPNILLALFNSVLLFLIVGGNYIEFANTRVVGGSGLFQLGTVPYWVKVLATVLFLDVISYSLHRLYHVSNFFWRFHRVHHSDTVFETSTAIRFHILEILFSMSVRACFVAVMGFSVLGLLIYELLFMAMNFSQHSDYAFSQRIENWLRKLVITPTVHRIHHSTERNRMNSNYGTILSLWDRLFGTFQVGSVNEKMVVGDGTESGFLSAAGLLKLPFKRHTK